MLKTAWRRAYLASRRARLTRVRAGGRPAKSPEPRALFDTVSMDAGIDTVAGYAPLPSEVDVTPILTAWVALGGKALIPTADALSTGRFAAPKWTNFGDDEDESDAATLNSARLILVPGLVFGTDGARLGRGAGWYDRALADRCEDALVLGVCHEKEVVGAGLVPTDAHDIEVDGVLTPEGLQLF